MPDDWIMPGRSGYAIVFDRPAQPDPHGSIYKGCEAMLVKAGYLFPSFRERGGGDVGHVQFQPAFSNHRA
jgi:hypothetical protein